MFIPVAGWAAKAGSSASKNTRIGTGVSTSGKFARSLSRSDLGAGQISNLTRYESKLPKGASQTTLSRGSNNTVEFSANVTGKVPGSYATYAKTVDEAGNTIKYDKTTVAPDGSVIHVKQKYP